MKLYMGVKKPTDKNTKSRKPGGGDDSDDNSSSPSKSLDDHGVHLLVGGIDESTTGDAIRFILEANLDQECKWEYITLIINSSGGYCTDGFALIDVMFGSRIPVRTVGIGMIASMGLLIFLAGQKESRTLTPNCLILSHQFSGGEFGKEHELIAGQKRFTQLTDIIMRHYKRTTGLSKEEIRECLLPPQDVWMTAKEAKAFGICDVVKDLKPKLIQ